ncbi:MAG: hypothetical protein ACK44L_18095, partial [Burkholderiales bacterium]
MRHDPGLHSALFCSSIDRRQEGAASLEQTILVGLVAAAIAGGVGAFGSAVSDRFLSSGASVDALISGAPAPAP